MFHHYRAHSLTKLAESFSDAIENDSLNPLHPQWVVVQNNEIKEWLTLQYARRKGIAANFRFIFPSDLIWKLYRIKKKEVPETLPSDLNALQWALFNLFSKQPDKLQLIPSFPQHQDDQKKLFLFCRQLADVFDQYQVYRPEITEQWLDGKKITSNPDEKWQAEIWRLLHSAWESDSNTKNIPRRAEAFTELRQWIESSDEILDKIPSSIHIFGLSLSNKPFLDIITSLSIEKDIHLFSKELTFSQIKDQQGVLFNRWTYPANEQQSLLKKLINEKDAGYNLLQPKEKDINNFPRISIHSCHNKRREVEVLKDEILHYLSNNKSSTASDILILVPDAEAYAGSVETVFSNDEGEPSLPVTNIAKRYSQSVAHSLVMLLNLISSSFKAGEVMQVMELLPIRQKFNFTDADIESIESWVVDNRILKGIGEDYNTPYSWAKGVNQLLAGFSMEVGEIDIYNGLIPYSGISTSDQIERAAKFSHFVQKLKLAVEELQSPKTPHQWLLFTEELLLNFIGSDSDSYQVTKIHKSLNKLKEQVSYAKVDETVSFELIKNWLTDQFISDNSNSGRFGHGITLSSYVPYRSLPFKFIAVLGLNESVFPRKSIRPSFDLIYSNPEVGDRTLKEDDTLLFLETIHAAQEQLHLSYEGQDQKTANLKLPSILVQQLKETLTDKKSGSEIKHALHSFNCKYYSGKEKKSFSTENAVIAKMVSDFQQDDQLFIESDSIWEVEKPLNINISEFISYFNNPSKYLMQNVLGVKNYSDIKEFNERENFKLAGLDKYHVDRLLENHLQEISPIELQQFAETSAILPEGLAGEKAFESEKILINELLTKVAEHTSESERKEEILIETEDISLSGNIQGICGSTFISYRVGRLKAKYLAEHWLKHLMLIYSGVDIQKSVYVYKDKNVRTLEIMTDNIDKNPLPEYIDWFLAEDSMLNKTAFFPESSKAFANKIIDNDDISSALKAAYKEWEPNQHKETESSDYFAGIVWRGRNPIETNAFKENAIKFWTPFFKTQRGR